MSGRKITVKMPGDSVQRLVDDVAKTTEEKKTAPAPSVKSKRKAKTAPSVSMILQARAEKELKSVAVNLRVKGSVKERFDLLCKKLGYSQSDFFEVLIDLAEETMKQQAEK